MDAAKQPARRNGSHNPAEACWKAFRVQIKLTPMRGRKILPAEGDRLPNHAACCTVYRSGYPQHSWSTGGSAHKANEGQNYHNSGTCHQGCRVRSLSHTQSTPTKRLRPPHRLLHQSTECTKLHCRVQVKQQLLMYEGGTSLSLLPHF